MLELCEKLAEMPSSLYSYERALETEELYVLSRWDTTGAVQTRTSAVEQYGFCPDVVDQGPEEATVGALADVLWQSTVWYFWWD